MNLRRAVRTRRRAAFTLVEMLAVLAIIGLLIGISIPVFNIIGSDRGVKSDAMKFNSVLRLARQQAIMNRTYTFVVLIDDFPGVLPEHRHRAYAVLQGTPDEPQTYVSPWHLLSKGVYFATMNDTTWTMPATERDLLVDTDPVDCPYPEAGSSKQPLLMLRYSPDGRCWTYDASGNGWKTGSGVHVVMAPGLVDAANQVVVPAVDKVRAGNIYVYPRTGMNSVRLEPKTT